MVHWLKDRKKAGTEQEWGITMKAVGIIAEYNPFHNGHSYQIKKAKEMTGADYCIVVMSGNYVQRGVPAIMDKYLRTQAALMGGADLIVELPVHYASGSAEYFASGAVSLLDKLGVVDHLCFGSECGDLQPLSLFADALISENEAFRTQLKNLLREGYSYPQARAKALGAVSPELIPHLELLNQPNNILGLEYLKALKRRNSRITPHTLARKGARYHDSDLYDSLSSALAIREAIASQKTLDAVSRQIPAPIYQWVETHFQKSFPILPKDLSLLLSCKLLREEKTGFTDYFGIDQSFSDRLCKLIYSYTGYDSLCEALKTKNITYTRAARNLLHILLDLKQADIDCFCKEGPIYYARVLGFQKTAAPLLSAVKQHASLPLITKLADAESLLPSENGKKMLQQNTDADHLYSMLVCNKFSHAFQSEYQKQVVIL